MATLHNLKPEKVIKAFERVGWINKGQRGSHVKLVKDGNPNILSIPVSGKENGTKYGSDGFVRC